MADKDTPPFLLQLAELPTLQALASDVSRYREIALTDPSRTTRDAFLRQMPVLVIGDVTDISLDHFAGPLDDLSIAPRDLAIFAVIDVNEQRDLLDEEDCAEIVASASFNSEANGDEEPKTFAELRRSEGFFYWEAFKDFRLGFADHERALNNLRHFTKGGQPGDDELCARLVAYGIRPEWLLSGGTPPLASLVSS